MPTKPLRPQDPHVLGDYTMLGVLGEGGMGAVYLGRGPSERLVAVKIIRPEFAAQAEFRGRFRSEVNRARQVPSFCTAAVLDADPDHETPYLVVEYVDGPDLADVVAEGLLTDGNLHSVAVGVATALVAIHGAGVIHRDLKPRNVLFSLGTPKVIDFGIARALESTSNHTRTDHMVGTLSYMAPERLDGLKVTPAVDVFAWGVLITYAATGRTPFAADTPTATAMRILTGKPELGRLDGDLRALVEHALAKDPEDRPTAQEVLDRLLAAGPAALTVNLPRSALARPTGPRPADSGSGSTGGRYGQRRPSGSGGFRSGGVRSGGVQPGGVQSGGFRPDDAMAVDLRSYDPRSLDGGAGESDDRRWEMLPRSARRRQRRKGWVAVLGGRLTELLSGGLPRGLPGAFSGAFPGALPRGRQGRAGPVRDRRVWMAIVGGVTAVIAAVALGLAARNATDDQEAAPPASVTTLPSPRKATDGPDVVVSAVDPLDGSGNWRKTTTDEYACTPGPAGLRITAKPNSDGIACPGPQTVFNGDQTIVVEMDDVSVDACAVIGFLRSADSGYRLGVCRDVIRLAQISASNRFDTISGTVRPTKFPSSHRVVIEIVDQVVTVRVDGDKALAQILNRDITKGWVELGIAQLSDESDGQVRFNGIEIRPN
ncbi:serine/threonine-protein kinase [Actinoplanes sp. NBRC 101535]|uniref:serine/threonine protein kinase n=1 Tax=Actinoplanes sp. NBRC 101535 TaxID=3032196 RepID=UPI0024A53DCA|nr:hypothetical protein Acsp01_85430 [Actinoplanes sp. NBRC 101535]